MPCCASRLCPPSAARRFACPSCDAPTRSAAFASALPRRADPATATASPHPHHHPTRHPKTTPKPPDTPKLHRANPNNRFTATIGDRVIVTEVKAKEEAEAEYREAVQQGHTAVMASQSISIFEVQLGNLEAMQECIITLSYLRLLDAFGSSLEYSHTATWVPPYLSARDLAPGNAAALADATPRFAQEVAYTLSYEVRVVAEGGVAALDSAEPVVVSDGSAELQCAKVRCRRRQPATPAQAAERVYLASRPLTSRPSGCCPS